MHLTLLMTVLDILLVESFILLLDLVQLEVLKLLLVVAVQVISMPSFYIALQVLELECVWLDSAAVVLMQHPSLILYNNKRRKRNELY